MISLIRSHCKTFPCPCVSSVLTKIIKTGYATLQLEYFFTAGPDEVRAWTVRVSTLVLSQYC